MRPSLKLYTVHVEKYGINPEPDIRLVKEGFNWAACVFSVVWALIKGYWWVALGLLGAEIVLSLGMILLNLDDMAQIILNIGFAAFVGVYANDLARWTLSRRGFVEDDVVGGQNAEHALQRYLNDRQTI